MKDFFEKYVIEVLFAAGFLGLGLGVYSAIWTTKEAAAYVKECNDKGGVALQPREATRQCIKDMGTAVKVN